MAAYFVDSTAAGAGTGADWTNAYTTIALALARPILAGDTLWISDIHAESTAASVTWTFPGTNASPNFVYCVDHTKASPGTGDLKTTGAVTVTGNTDNLNVQNSLYLYGIVFTVGGTTSGTINLNQSSGNRNQKYEACSFVSAITSGFTGLINPVSSSTGYTEWINCTVTVNDTNGSITGQGRWVWRNTASAIVGATLPTNFVNNANQGSVLFEGVDLSALGSGKTLYVASVAQDHTMVFKDCKLGASVTVSNTPQAISSICYVTRTDSSGTNYIEQVYHYAGTQTDETTIVRTGGATDGTTVKSRKIVTTANSKWVLPFESDPISFWNDSTSAITDLTIYGTTTGGGVPKDDEIWIDVEYLGAAGSPLGSFKTSTKANNLAASAATNNSADGSTWGGGGAGNGFKIVVPSFTPGQKGPITIYIKAAKASTTYYVDPKPTMTGLTVSKSYVVGGPVLVNELSSGGISRARAQAGF